MIVLIPIENELILNGFDRFMPKDLVNDYQNVCKMAIDCFNSEDQFISDLYQYIANTELENELIETDNIQAFELMVVLFYESFKNNLIQHLGFTPSIIEVKDKINNKLNNLNILALYVK